MKEKREKRLNSEFQREIYQILSTEVKDTRLTEMFSISSVHIATDLKTAKVYISIFSTDESKKKATFEAIKSSAGFVRHQLSVRMHIRTVPEFTFMIDDREFYSQKIESILSEIKSSENKDKKEESDENN